MFKRNYKPRERVYPTPIPEHLRRNASFTAANEAPAPVPKRIAQKNATLLDMARGRECNLRIPGVCCGNWETTVACHANWQEFGKGMGQKADDTYTVFGCVTCHKWLDQGQADAELKREAFKTAMIRQRQSLLAIAADPSEKEKHRKAADWALNRLIGAKV